MHNLTHVHAHTLLVEIEVTVDNSVYNIDEQSNVRICASRSGSIEGTIYLNLDVAPGTADGKQNYYSHMYVHIQKSYNRHVVQINVHFVYIYSLKFVCMG